MEKNNHQPLIVANWKMHKTLAEASGWLDELLSHDLSNKDLVIAPSFTLLNFIKDKITNTKISLAGQDCSSLSSTEGAFTGDISAMMLADVGCKYVIIGHSERRKYYQESNLVIKDKISQAHQAKLIAIVCVGENLSARENGNYKEFVWQELESGLPSTVNFENTIFAYEPIWAIGTGKTADIEQIQEMHEFLSKQLQNLFKKSLQIFEQTPKIIYGGSVNEENANKILSANYVSGLLVGGASLNANKFYQISKSI